MKKVLTFLLASVFAVSCSDSNEGNNATPPPYEDSAIVLSIVDANGEKLMSNGTINRDDVVIEYKKGEEYVPALNHYCSPDLSDFTLYDYTYFLEGQLEKVINFRLTFPDQQVVYADVIHGYIPREETNIHSSMIYVKKVYINNELIYEGDVSTIGDRCNDSFLKFDVIVNE